MQVWLIWGKHIPLWVKPTKPWDLVEPSYVFSMQSAVSFHFGFKVFVIVFQKPLRLNTVRNHMRPLMFVKSPTLQVCVLRSTPALHSNAFPSKYPWTAAFEANKVNKTSKTSRVEASSLMPGKFPRHLKSRNAEGKTTSGANNLCWDVWNQIGNELALDAKRRGRDLKFLSDHWQLLTDGNQPTPDQTMLKSDHSHRGFGDDRKHRRALLNITSFCPIYDEMKARGKAECKCCTSD